MLKAGLYIYTGKVYPAFIEMGFLRSNAVVEDGQCLAIILNLDSH
jgi:hypothetical protein